MDSKPIEILLGSSRHKTSTNEDNFIGLELASYEKAFPSTEGSYTVDAYEQYFKECDASDKHRFVFTVTPFCTNILFNVLTEPVYKEGSNDCFTITDGVYDGANPYENYNVRDLNRANVIRDTGYSHPRVGDYPLVYHCGLDIFNNHFLRKRDFIVVNRGSRLETWFNTISDVLRTSEGEQVKEKILQINHGTKSLNTGDTSLHLYQYSNIKSYVEAAFDGIVDSGKKGWVGFYNVSTIPIGNVPNSAGTKYYSINKCMNNNKAWEQIDMYPDRSLYSFVPKINKFRGRVENNWEYMITYPYYNFYDNDVVRYSKGNTEVKGLRCKLVTPLDRELLEDENVFITFKSFVRHNLHVGEHISISVIMSGEKERKTSIPVKIVSVGINGEDKEHYFSVRLTQIMSVLANIPSGSGSFTVNSLISEDDIDEIRFRKNENGADCEYYIRIFKKVGENLTSSLNKLAFSQTIYSDQVAQIVFTDDVLANKRDNLNRPVSEVFLTLVKTNKGYKEWYEDGNTTGDTIEFSHCFGKITSGFDFPEDEECSEFNVHRIHSIDGDVEGVTPSKTPLESEITSDSGSTDAFDVVPDEKKNEGDVFFFGDLVEFSLPRLEETVLEDVFHRFNTAQREFYEGTDVEHTKYGKFVYDEIVHDDFDIGEGFSVEERHLLNREHVNIVPEGYYYKPHYGVKIRSFETEVQQGSDIKVVFSEATGDGLRWTIHTAKNYYFEAPINYKIDEEEYTKNGSPVIAYRIDGGKLTDTVYGVCVGVSGNTFSEVEIEFEREVNLSNGLWRLFRRNTEHPEYALDLNDGTGRYIWRNVLSYSDMMPDDELYEETFTNGAHYHHKNIMFYLRRQDPHGDYGIGNEPEDIGIMLFEGIEKKDVTVAEYKKEGEGTIC